MSENTKHQYFIIFSVFCYRLNDCLTKLVVDDLGPFGTLFFRSLFTLVLIPLFMIYTKFNYSSFLDKNVIIRNVLAGVALLFEIASLEYISLSTFVLLIYTVPIFTKIFARVFLKEAISLLDIGAISLSFIGAFCILDFSFDAQYIEGVIFALLGALLYSLSIIVTKKVKEPDIASIYISYIIVLFLISTLKIPEYIPGYTDLGLLFAMAFIHIAAFLCHLKGFLALRTSRAVLLEYTGLLFAVEFDYFFWDKMLSPIQLLGGIMILLPNLFSIYREAFFLFFKKVYVSLR